MAEVTRWGYSHMVKRNTEIATKALNGNIRDVANEYGLSIERVCNLTAKHCSMANRIFYNISPTNSPDLRGFLRRSGGMISWASVARNGERT